MAYYQDTSVSGTPELNYYYYMASQFALSDRWFSPVSSKSTPNRIATLTGGTTQGLVFDPFVDDKLTATLTIQTIFQELDQAKPRCLLEDLLHADAKAVATRPTETAAIKSNPSLFPVTTFSDFGYSGKYLYATRPAACVAPTVGSKQAVGDPSNHSALTRHTSRR